jgi:hypothetical protein
LGIQGFGRADPFSLITILVSVGLGCFVGEPMGTPFPACQPYRREALAFAIPTVKRRIAGVRDERLRRFLRQLRLVHDCAGPGVARGLGRAGGADPFLVVTILFSVGFGPFLGVAAGITFLTGLREAVAFAIPI